MRDSLASSPVLASASNPIIKRIRSLQRRKIRQQERAFVVEGLRSVRDFLESGATAQVILVRSGDEAIAPDAIWNAGTVRVVEPSLFDEISDTSHPQGILGVFDMPNEADLPPWSDRLFVVVLDAIRDPGNMGTLLRSAAAAGVDHLIIAPDCVDPWQPKVVRAAMGAHTKIGFSHQSWPSIADYSIGAGAVVIADADGSNAWESDAWQQGAIVIVGGEANGPSLPAKNLATMSIAIPMCNEIESLNAAMAGTLLMFEAMRRRSLSH